MKTPRQHFDDLLRQKEDHEKTARRVSRTYGKIQNLLADDLSALPAAIRSALKELVSAYKALHPRAKKAGLSEVREACPEQAEALDEALQEWRFQHEKRAARLETELRQAALPCEVQGDPDHLVALEPRAWHIKTYTHACDARIKAAGWVRAGVPNVGVYHADGGRQGGGERIKAHHTRGYAIYARVAASDATLARHKCVEISFLEQVAYREHVGWHPSPSWLRREEYALTIKEAKSHDWDFSDVP